MDANNIGDLEAARHGLHGLLNQDSKQSAWWLDIQCPSSIDFNHFTDPVPLHPQTLADVRADDRDEKLEFYKGYYYVRIRGSLAINTDQNYKGLPATHLIVFPNGLVSLSSKHLANVSNIRTRLFKEYGHGTASSNYICYALIYVDEHAL